MHASALLLLLGRAAAFSSMVVDRESLSGPNAIAATECGGQGHDGYIVRGEASLPLDRLVEKLRGAEVFHRIAAINAVSARGIGDALLRTLRTDAKVKDVSLNCIVRLDVQETNAESTHSTSTEPAVPWGIDRIDSRDGLDDTYSPAPEGDDGAQAVVYVLDTGIRISNEDFEGRAEPGWSAGCGSTSSSCEPGWAFRGVIDDDVNEQELARTEDTRDPAPCSGHGTHCASTAAGRHYGVAPRATVVAVQVLSCEGSGSTAGIMAGIEWAVNDRAKRGRPGILSMSLGGAGASGYDEIMDFAMDAGLFVSVAAGNSHLDACLFSPAYVPRIMTVGATEKDDAMASYSNYGRCIDVFAPGTDITAAWSNSDDEISTISGTSMACPHVSGAAARLMSADPSLSADEVKQKLLCMSTADGISLDRRARWKRTANSMLYNGADHSC